MRLLFISIYSAIYASPLFVTHGFICDYNVNILCFLYLCLGYWLLDEGEKAKELFFFAYLHLNYLIVSSILLPNVNLVYYLFEFIVFCSLLTWLWYKPKLPQNDYNRMNVLLAFYKGKKGSFIMNIGAVLGLPVKSVCVLYSDYVLRLKNGKSNFIKEKKASAVLSSNDYIIVDTGVALDGWVFQEADRLTIDKAYISENIKIRANCVKGLLPFLKRLGCKFTPHSCVNYIPSLYFKQVIG